MKYAALAFLMVIAACAGDGNTPVTRLMSEQKRLKDSAVIINEKIGSFLKKGLADSAVAQQQQLAAVYARLTAIQSAIDSRSK